MSDRVICQGCGQRFDLPEGYARNKIQCPLCGVITPVEQAAGRRAGRPGDDTPFDTAGAPSQGNPIAHQPPPPEPEPDLSAIPDRRSKEPAEDDPAKPQVWTCPNCGEWQRRRPRGKKAVCPVCKEPVAAPVMVRTKSVEQVVREAMSQPRVAVPQTEWSEDPEDSKPYRVDAVAQPACPGCGRPMEPQAIVCVNCGHDLRVGTKAKTAYDPIVKRWDAGLARPLRWLGFAVWQFFAVPPMIWGASHEGHAFYVIGGWLWLSLMAAFLFGTYDRIDLERNRRGKVRLVNTWHFCFVPRAPMVIDLIEYEGILTGQAHELGFTDYVVLLSGIGFGLIPGIVWYFAIMQRDTWYVALTKDHGHPELMLYRGWNEQRAKEIAATLRTAALPEYPWY